MENRMMVIKTVDSWSRNLILNIFEQNPDGNLELNVQREITAKLLDGDNNKSFNSNIGKELAEWNQNNGEPGICFVKSMYFSLENGSVRSPDIAWVANDRWQNRKEPTRKNVANVCPDFVVITRTINDHAADLKAKMEEYRDNGCRLAWLIDRQSKAVHIYREDGSIEIKKGNSVQLSGEDVLPGFVVEIDL